MAENYDAYAAAKNIIGGGKKDNGKKGEKKPEAKKAAAAAPTTAATHKGRKKEYEGSAASISLVLYEDMIRALRMLYANNPKDYYCVSHIVREALRSYEPLQEYLNK